MQSKTNNILGERGFVSPTECYNSPKSVFFFTKSVKLPSISAYMPQLRVQFVKVETLYRKIWKVISHEWGDGVLMNLPSKGLLAPKLSEDIIANICKLTHPVSQTLRVYKYERGQTLTPPLSEPSILVDSTENISELKSQHRNFHTDVKLEACAEANGISLTYPEYTAPTQYNTGCSRTEDVLKSNHTPSDLLLVNELDDVFNQLKHLLTVVQTSLEELPLAKDRTERQLLDLNHLDEFSKSSDFEMLQSSKARRDVLHERRLIKDVLEICQCLSNSSFSTLKMVIQDYEVIKEQMTEREYKIREPKLMSRTLGR